MLDLTKTTITQEELFNLTDSKYKEDYLFSILEKESDFKKVRQLALSTYCELEHIQNYAKFKSVFQKTKGFVSEYELEFDDDIITIYRGEASESTNISTALSWTVSKATAIWFANRFGNQGKVYSAEINKDDILISTNLRKEFEVLVNPTKVRGITLL